MKKYLAAIYTVCFLIMFEAPTFAYIDPSVMTYTIQAVAGIAIAVGATIGIIWRKARMKAKQVLKIEENTKKEVEEDIIEINPDEKR